MTQLRFPRRTRRGREWFPKVVNIVNILAAGGQGDEIIDTGIPPDDKKSATIVRMLIDLEFKPTSTVVPIRFAVGITLMNEDAHAAAALPEPGKQDTEDADWLWLVPQAAFEVSSTSAPRARYFILDIHSKRVYNARTDILVLVVDNLATSGGLDVTGSVRTLILDPP